MQRTLILELCEMAAHLPAFFILIPRAKASGKVIRTHALPDFRNTLPGYQSWFQNVLWSP
jgi:hypothetical protein